MDQIDINLTLCVLCSVCMCASVCTPTLHLYVQVREKGMYCIRDWEVLARAHVLVIIGADVTDLQFTGSLPITMRNDFSEMFLNLTDGRSTREPLVGTQ